MKIDTTFIDCKEEDFFICDACKIKTTSLHELALLPFPPVCESCFEYIITQKVVKRIKNE